MRCVIGDYKAILLAVLIGIFFSVPVRAQGPNNRPFGLGLCLGEPAGVTAKYWFDRKNALDAAVGYGFYPHHGVAIYADYLYNFFTLVEAGKFSFELLLYGGIGGKLGFWEHNNRGQGEDKSGVGAGVRLPIGLTMVFTKFPFDVFLEIAPALGFGAPDTVWFDLDACIGGRFYF